MSESELRALYIQLLDHNAQTFAGRHFEVAYHTLAAALHCAEELRDGSLIGEVQRLAQEQGQWIDTYAPAHRLSSRSARTRGNESIFTSMTKQAHVLLLGLQLERQKEMVRELNERDASF